MAKKSNSQNAEGFDVPQGNESTHQTAVVSAATMPPPAPVPRPEKEIHPDAGQEQLPDDPKELFALLARLDNEPELRGAKELARRKRIEAVRNHVHAIQQGLATVHINGNDLAVMHQARLTAHQRMNQRLEELAAKHPELKKAIIAHTKRS